MGRRLAAAAVIAGIVVALAVAWRSAGGLAAVNWIAGLVGVGVVVAGLIGWARRRPARPPAASTRGQVGAAEEVLAKLVLRQWEDEAKVRRLFDPGPLAVRWRLTEPELMDHPTHIGSNGGISFTGTTGEIGAMTDALRALARRRLVILGEAGTGKTTLAVLLLRHLLTSRQSGEAVPVLLTLSSWDPAAEPYPAWLTRRIGEDYPALRADDFGPTAIRDLVELGRVLPVLDGLDELPPVRRRQVVDALNRELTDRDGFVLTCRTAEYRETIRGPGAGRAGDPLTAAAVIEPDPLAGADVAAYLASCLPPDPGGCWPTVLGRLGDSADPLGTALRTPLMVWLVRAVYVDTGADPVPLLAAAGRPEPHAVRDHLLDHVIPALLSTPVTDALPQPFRPRRAWDPDRARCWLTRLAAHLARLRTRDLAWWDLPRTMPGRRGLAVGLTVGLAGSPVGIAVGLALGFLFGPVVGVLAGLGFWLAFNAVEGLAAGLKISSSLEPARANLQLGGRARPLVRELVPLVAVGLAGGLAAWIAAGLAGFGLGSVSLPVVFASVAALVLGVFRWARTPTAADEVRDPDASIVADRRFTIATMLAAGSIVGLALGLGSALVFESVLFGLVLGLGIGLGAGIDGVLVSECAWSYYLIALVRSAAAGRLPWRLMPFLADMHRVGVLRQAGGVYQFRHAALQDHLARGHGPPDG